MLEWRDLDASAGRCPGGPSVLDRLYGYEVSPVLWKKIMPRLSAGRVQSVATRMVVERERARMVFRSAGWWGIDATFTAHRGTGGRGHAPARSPPLWPRWTEWRWPWVSDFDETGTLAASNPVVVLAEDEARALAAGLADVPFAVSAMTHKPFRRSPAAPFITSTLQQEAGRKLRFGPERAMQVAQRLYEDGWITYMRTD